MINTTETKKFSFGASKPSPLLGTPAFEMPDNRQQVLLPKPSSFVEDNRIQPEDNIETYLAKPKSAREACSRCNRNFKKAGFE